MEQVEGKERIRASSGSWSQIRQKLFNGRILIMMDPDQGCKDSSSFLKGYPLANKLHASHGKGSNLNERPLGVDACRHSEDLVSKSSQIALCGSVVC